MGYVVKKAVLAAGTTAWALVWAATATAQKVPAGADEVLDEVVVTAERAHRTLRETASSVAVSTQADIERSAGVYSVNRLLDRVPNITTTEPGNDLPAVRGIDGTGPGGGATAFFAGARPRFSYQVDGRTLSANEATFGDTSLWDIEQVEVYRGPQSTLLGRNAIAGVVAIKTTDPTFDWQGAARAVTGNRDEVQMSGAVGGPIAADLLAFRLSADWSKSRDFVDFVGYPGTGNPGRYDNRTFRGKLLLTASPSVRSLLTVSYQDGREPQSNWVKQPFKDEVSIDGGLAQPVFRSRVTNGISDTTVALDDAVSLQVLLSASDFRVDRYSPPGLGISRIDGDEYLAQPLLRYAPAGGRLSGFIAAHVFRARQDETNDLLGGGAYRDKTDTTSVFGEVTFRPTEALSLILGSRYEEEERDRDGATGPLVTDFHETYTEFLPKATVSLDVAPQVTLGVSAARGYSPGGSSVTLSPPFLGYTYQPEHVWSYEGFARAGLGHDLALTGNVFHSRYEDLQLPFYLSALSVEIRNAGRATTYGAEAGLTWRPAPKNEVFANMGLLDTKIDRYEDPSSAGNELPRSPAFNLAAGFNFSPGGKLEFGADVRYSSAYFSDTLNEARGKVDPYTIVNARVAYHVGPALLFLTARNLLDSRKPVMKGILNPFDPASDYAVLLEPRKISAGVELRF